MGGGGGEESFSLFGSLGGIDIVTGTVSLIIVIVSVLSFEAMFFHIEEATVDTPFAAMIAGIQKELMIVGGMAFILKCIISTVSFDVSWLHSIEFADLVVPVAAFFFCLFGVLFIYVLRREDSIVRHALGEVPSLDPARFFQHASKLQLWLPFDFVKSGDRQNLEYQIAKVIFCSEYLIADEDKFPFDLYVIMVFEKYILGIINIEASNWVIIIVLALLNWARMELKIFASIHECTDSHGHLDKVCANMNDIAVFTVIGAILLGVVLAVAIVSRYYQLRVLGVYGNHREVTLYMQQEPAPAQQPLESPAKDIYEAIRNARQKKIVPTGLVDRVKKFFLSGLRELDLITEENEPEFSSKMASVYLFGSPRLYFKTIDYLIMFISFYMSLWLCNFLYSTDEFRSPDRELWKVYSLLPGILSLGLYSYVIRASSFLMAVTLKDPDILEEVDEHLREVKVLGEFIRSKILYSLLSSRADYTGVANVESYLAEHNSEQNEKIVTDLFQELDPDSTSLKMSRKELQLFLIGIGVNFSTKKWRQIFREVDRNGDDSISVEEMIFFLFNKNKNAATTVDKQQAFKKAVMEILPGYAHTAEGVDVLPRSKSRSAIPNVLNMRSLSSKKVVPACGEV